MLTSSETVGHYRPMHILRNGKPIAMRGIDNVLPAGEWVCHDVNAFELALFADRTSVFLQSYGYRINNSGTITPQSILIIRSGAIGDLLFLSPAIRALQAKNPDLRVTLACFEKHHAIAQGFPEVEIIPYPVSLDVAQKFDHVISLENVVENETEMHATDVFAKALGVTVEDYIPQYRVLPNEQAARCDLEYDGQERPRVALQLKASARSRDYPMPLWEKVIDGLTERGWEILLYGSVGQIPKIVRPKDNVHDCSHLTFREAAALLKTCKVFCGVDSAFMNLCPALDVPAIGLYGPVKWQTRIGKAGKQLGLTGTKSCSGCNWMNSRAGQSFPPDMPCAKLGYCEVLAEIDPKGIIAKIDQYRK